MAQVKIFQAKFKPDSIHFQVLQTEVARALNLTDLDLARKTLDQVKKSKVYLQAQKDLALPLNEELINRWELVNAIHFHVRQNHLLTVQLLDPLINKLRFEANVETFLVASFIRQNSLYNLGRVEEIRGHLEKLESDHGLYGRPIGGAYFLKTFLQTEILSLTAMGDFDTLIDPKTEFFNIWDNSNSQNLSFLSVLNFELFCLAEFFINQFEAVGRRLMAAIEKGVFESHSLYASWSLSVLKFLKETEVIDSTYFLSPKFSQKNLKEAVSKLGSLEPAGLQIYFFELQSQNFFQSKTVKKIRNLTGGQILGSGPRNQIYQAYFLGLADLVEGNVLEARKILDSVYARARDWNFHFFEARTLVCLALLDVYAGAFDSALNKLDLFSQCLKSQKDLQGRANPWPEKEEFKWAPVIESFAQYKLGHFEKSEAALLLIPADSSVRALVDFMSVEIGRPRPKGIVCSEAGWRFYEKIFALMVPQKLSKIEVTTDQGSRVYFLHSLPAFKPKDYFLYFNETTRELFVKNKMVNIKGSPLQLQLLKFLLEYPGLEVSKFDLATRVWKESYNPPIHDPRIYMAIMRLRKLMGQPGPGLIEFSGTGYRLILNGAWVWIKGLPGPKELTERQHWIMGFLETHESVTRNFVQKSLKIGPTLAKRELGGLLNRGLLKRLGKARATEYSKVRG